MTTTSRVEQRSIRVHHLSNGMVFVAEPVVNLELNVAKWFRINVGAGYRIVAGVNVGDLENGDLSSFFGNLAFKFGSF